MEKTCILCCSTIATNTSHGVAAKVPKSENAQTVEELLNWTFCENNLLNRKLAILPPTDPLTIEKRRICFACLTAAKNCYLWVSTLRTKLNNSSYIAELINQYEIADNLANSIAQVDVRGNTTPPPRTQNWFESPKSRGEQPLPLNTSVQLFPVSGTSSDANLSATTARKITPVRKKITNALRNKRKASTVSNTVAQIVKKEIKSLTNDFLHQEDSDNFNLSDTSDFIINMKKHCPVLFDILGGLFKKNRKDNNYYTYIRVVASMATWLKNKKCSGLQRAVALVLYKNQASKKAYNTFNKLGISLSYSATIETLDRLRIGFDSQLVYWRKDVEDYLRNPKVVNFQPIVRASNDVEKESDDNAKRRNSIHSSSDESEIEEVEDLISSDSCSSCEEKSTKKKKLQTIQSVPQDTTKIVQRDNIAFTKINEEIYFKGLSFSFDNLNRLIRRKQHSSTNANIMSQMVSVFAVFSRVPIKAEILLQRKRVNFADLPLSTWLLTAEDDSLISGDRINEIERILCRHLLVFRRLRKRINFHTEHEFSKEMQQKSEMVNLGIWGHDESKMDEMLKIMQRLDRYVPRFPNGDKLPIPVYGDGGTTIGMQNAQKHYDVNCIDKNESLQGLQALNSPWHRKLLLLQADWNVLMKDQSLTYADGCMPNFRARFGHISAKMNVKDDFNHSFAFMRFNLESYVLAWAVKLLQFSTETIEHVPQEFADLHEDHLLDILHELAQTIEKQTRFDLLTDIRQESLLRNLIFKLAGK